MQTNLTFEDAKKIDAARWYIGTMIENIESFNKKHDLSGNPPSMLTEAYRLLTEVLYE